MKTPLVSVRASALASTLAIAALLPLAATTVQAQEQDKAEQRKERIEQFNKRFGDADVDGNGQLTRAEAQAKMPGVAAKFDEIDADRKGYVTKQDIARSMKKALADSKKG